MRICPAQMGYKFCKFTANVPRDLFCLGVFLRLLRAILAQGRRGGEAYAHAAMFLFICGNLKEVQEV